MYELSLFPGLSSIMQAASASIINQIAGILYRASNQDEKKHMLLPASFHKFSSVVWQLKNYIFFLK